MKRASALILQATLLLACHPISDLTPPPTAEGARSMLLFVEGKGVTNAFAIDIPSSGTPEYPVFSRPDELQLTAVQYKCDLETLGMVEGPQLLDSPTARVELPTPLALRTALDSAGAQSSWLDVDPVVTDSPERTAAEALLKEVVLPEDNLCRLHRTPFELFEEEAFEVSTSTAQTLVVPLDENRAFVGTVSGEFFELSWVEASDKDVVRLLPVQLSTNTPHHAGFMRGDEIWVVGDRGELAHGPFPGTGPNPAPFTEVAVRTSSRSVSQFVDASTADQPLEIFRATWPIGTFERFDGEGWEVLVTAEQDRIFRFPSVVWVGPGEAMAAGVGPPAQDGGSVFWYRAGMPLAEIIVPEGGVSGLIKMPSGQILAGLDNGRMAWYRGDGRFEVAPAERKVEGPVTAFAPSSQGFIYGQSSFAEYIEGIGHCAQPVTSRAALQLIPLNGVYIAWLVPEFVFDRPSPMDIVRPLGTRPACLE